MTALETLFNDLYSKECLANKLEVVEMLLDHGASAEGVADGITIESCNYKSNWVISYCPSKLLCIAESPIH
jgi:hypothetical protein